MSRRDLRLAEDGGLLRKTASGLGLGGSDLQVRDRRLQPVKNQKPVVGNLNGRLEQVADSVKSLQCRAEDAANLFEHEVVARNDLLATQVALSEARQQSIQARNALDLAQATYNRPLAGQ